MKQEGLKQQYCVPPIKVLFTKYSYYLCVTPIYPIVIDTNNCFKYLNIDNDIRMSLNDPRAHYLSNFIRSRHRAN